MSIPTIKTPRERVESLLRIHGGHCFIVACCEDYTALEASAREMESEGLCWVTHSTGTGGQHGLDVKKKGYRVGRMSPDLVEGPSH